MNASIYCWVIILVLICWSSTVPDLMHASSVCDAVGMAERTLLCVRQPQDYEEDGKTIALKVQSAILIQHILLIQPISKRGAYSSHHGSGGREVVADWGCHCLCLWLGKACP